MITIAWDKILNTAILPEREPVSGEWCKIVNGKAVTFKEFTVSTTTELISINIDTVTGDGVLSTNSDNTEVTCMEGLPITVSGSLAIPDQEFSVRCFRDDGRVVVFGVSVVGGAFTANLKFKASGEYTFSNKSINKNLPEPIFTIKETLMIVRMDTT